MLLVGSRLINTPVMSLQTGSAIAKAKAPVINPANLKITAYRVDSDLVNSKKPVFLVIDDIRELSDIGFIVDSADDLVEYGDVIKLDEYFDLNFPLIGMPVTDEKRRSLGKVTDYTVEVSSFTIQQLSIKRPLLKRVNDTELLVHRSQIIEINNDAIVIHSKAEIPEHTRVTTPGSYVNPFRSTSPTS